MNAIDDHVPHHLRPSRSRASAQGVPVTLPIEPPLFDPAGLRMELTALYHAVDDAKALRWFNLTDLPQVLCFDHGQILADYQRYRETGIRPRI